MSRSAALKVQMWGNSLAVRIPAAIARSAALSAGQVVEVSVQDFGVVIIPAGPKEMSLAERLHAFDPELHGGEVMASLPLGSESM